MKPNAGKTPAVYALLLSICLVVSLFYAAYYEMAETDIFNPRLQSEMPGLVDWGFAEKLQCGLFPPPGIPGLGLQAFLVPSVSPGLLNPPGALINNPLRC
jgi:hypothetical protein